MAESATNLCAIPALAQLQVHPSKRRVSISRDHISDLENRIQHTLVAIAKSRALIAQSDEVCNRVWGTTAGVPSLYDEFWQESSGVKTILPTPAMDDYAQ